MELIYHKGKNFGDAINPIIFDKLFGEKMAQEDTTEILGIGSILGHFKPSDLAQNFIVFSSGYAGGDVGTYGDVPEVTDKYNIICVRGKKTAKALGIDSKLAISDGALLISRLVDIPNEKKIFDFSYMPHVGSLEVFDKWPKLLSEIGIHLIDPRKPPMEVLKEMKQSKVLMTEAMHGAIIADAIQLPWIPVKTIKTINEFKWKDYLETVDLEYLPNQIQTLYSESFLKELFKKKLTKFGVPFLAIVAARLYTIRQSKIVKKVKRDFESLKTATTYNCTVKKLKEKQDQLLEAAEKIKSMI